MAGDFYQQGLAGAPLENSALPQDPSLQRIVETADYVSQRALQLDEQVRSVEQIVQHLGALARQLRTLSSNTTLEATRMRMNGPLAEIARQMRRISQQINESNDDLAVTLRGYQIATGELREAAETLIGDARTAIGPLEPPPTTLLAFTTRMADDPVSSRNGTSVQKRAAAVK